MCHRSNIDELCKLLGAAHDHTEWRLSFDSHTVSLIVVLLCNGVEMPSVLLVSAFGLKEPYNTIELSKTADSDTVSTYQVSSVQLVTDKKLEAFNKA